LAGKVTSGAVFVDGRGIGDVGSAVLRDRTQLSQDGMMTIAVAVDPATGKAVAGPEIVTRGFVYVSESEELLNEIREVLVQAINDLDQEQLDVALLRSVLRDRALEIIVERTGRRPMILAVVMEVGRK